MELHLFDSYSREVRLLKPLQGNKISFYCCGPTVYGSAHIGNFRTFVVQDVLRRILEGGGYDVVHIRNLTDVDDKTIRASLAEGVALATFTDKWRDLFFADCDSLNLLPPHHQPSAVATIPNQIDLIEKLLAKGHAYAAEDGSVYFSVSSFPSYGELARVTCQSRDPAHGRHQHTLEQDEYGKEEVLDFALWKAAKESDGPNFWPSPWGNGRPGWHIECSAMALSLLGEQIDLHGGGEDLLFPHHENEKAQVEAVTGTQFVRHWTHTSHLLVEGKKMSKSLGNLFTIQDLRERGVTPAEVRYVLLGGHYRKPLNFAFESFSGARAALKRLGEAVGEEVSQGGSFVNADWLSVAPLRSALDSLLQDLNVPEALGHIFVAVRLLDGEDNSERLATIRRGVADLVWMLGLQPSAGVDSNFVVPSEVSALAQARFDARSAKNWLAADECRDKIRALGFQVEDGPGGTWKVVPLK